MNKRHYEHTLPNIRGSLSNTYDKREAGAFNLAGLPTAGGLFGEQGYVSVYRNHLALLTAKEIAPVGRNF